MQNIKNNRKHIKVREKYKKIITNNIKNKYNKMLEICGKT